MYSQQNNVEVYQKSLVRMFWRYEQSNTVKHSGFVFWTTM